MIRKLMITAALMMAAPLAAQAAECSVDLEGNDAMKFNKTNIDVPKSCKDFTVNLKHTGKLKAAQMGHNWVLTKTADMAGVVTDGAAAGLDKNYVKAGDARVLAHTKVVGGGESDAVTFATKDLQAGGAYSYFCSFPGHSALMKGTLTVSK